MHEANSLTKYVPDAADHCNTWLTYLSRSLSGTLPPDVADKPKNEPTSADKLLAVAASVAGMHALQYVGWDANNGLFYCYDPEQELFRELSPRQLVGWVTSLWSKNIPLLGSFTDRQIQEAIKTIKTLTSLGGTDIMSIPKNLIRVAPGTYWNADLGELTQEEPSLPPFYKLFDTPKERADVHVPQVAPFTKEQVDTLLDRYHKTIKELEATEGDLEERYPYFQVWANNNHEVYMDLLRVIAYCFVRKKPTGAVLLIGLARNGKSSFVYLLHTIFGRNNTSMVKMSEIGDTHHVTPLIKTLLNAPDEEDKRPIQHSDFFKTITDHGTAAFPMMRSAEPVSIKGDFMCFFPMNHNPAWSGSETSALLKRSWIIPFEADLSAMDKKVISFEESTYTAENLCDLLGTVLGLANYFSRHDIEQSARMEAEREALSDEVGSGLSYRAQFERFFDGFESWDILFKDYAAWCKAYDMKISPLKDLKFFFKPYRAPQAKRRIKIGGQRVRLYQLPRPNHSQLYSEFRAPEFVEHKWDETMRGFSVAQLQEKGISMVERLQEYYEDKMYEEAEEVFSDLPDAQLFKEDT